MPSSSHAADARMGTAANSGSRIDPIIIFGPIIMLGVCMAFVGTNLC